jgi:hypothetical protein
LPSSSPKMNVRILDVICLAVLCVILTLGLWPFHSPRNDVTWLGNRNGLRFGTYATVTSSSAFPMAEAESGSGSVEVWLRPGRIWDSSTILAFYTPGSPCRLSLRQSLTDLELLFGNSLAPYPWNLRSLPGWCTIWLRSYPWRRN